MTGATTRPRLVLFTDGSCVGNPGPGGWAVVVLCEEPRRRGQGRRNPTLHHVQTIKGNEVNSTTNNRMELVAAIQALRWCCPHACAVIVCTDSMYVRNGILEWLPNWRRNGWKTPTGRDIKNQDLWKELVDVVEASSGQGGQGQCPITWQWGRGHSGNVWNQLADRFATQMAAEARAGHRHQLCLIYDTTTAAEADVGEKKSAPPQEQQQEESK